MIDDFDGYHSQVVAQAVNRSLLVDYSRSALHRLKRSGLEFEFPSMPEDDNEAVYVKRMGIQLGDAVLDVGAYAGFSVYCFSKAVGHSGIVSAFEPDEITFPLLQRNIARHGLTNVKSFKLGLWSKTTTLSFLSEGTMGFTVAHLVARDSHVTQVDVVSLAVAAALSGAKRVSAVKLDIEGAEVAVLQGAADFIRLHRPTFLIESHLVGTRRNTNEICDLLRSYGYTVEIIPQGVAPPLVLGRVKVKQAIEDQSNVDEGGEHHAESFKA